MSVELRLMTMQEAADAMRVSKATAIRLAKAGKLKVVPLGLSARAWRVHPADLEALINTSRQAPKCLSASAATRGRSLSVTKGKSIADLLATGQKPRLVRSRTS